MTWLALKTHRHTFIVYFKSWDFISLVLTFKKKIILIIVYREGRLCEGQKMMSDSLDLELQAFVVLMAESPLQVQLL